MTSMTSMAALTSQSGSVLIEGGASSTVKFIIQFFASEIHSSESFSLINCSRTDSLLLIDLWNSSGRLLAFSIILWSYFLPSYLILSYPFLAIFHLSNTVLLLCLKYFYSITLLSLGFFIFFLNPSFFGFCPKETWI